MINFIPRGNKTRKERIRSDVKRHPFACCAISLVDNINLNLIYRSLANFSGMEMFVIGSNQWHKGATNGVEDIIKIRYFSSFNNFHSYIRNSTEYTLIAIEQSDKSVLMNDFKYPKNPCFIFGSEATGLGDDVLLNVGHVVEIPMEDPIHPSLNVGCSSAITFYDFVRKYNIE